MKLCSTPICFLTTVLLCGCGSFSETKMNDNTNSPQTKIVSFLTSKEMLTARIFSVATQPGYSPERVKSLQIRAESLRGEVLTEKDQTRLSKVIR